jgi:hypothetical protein
MRLVTHRATDAKVCGCYAGSHGQQCVSQAQIGDEDQRRSFARPEKRDGLTSRSFCRSLTLKNYRLNVHCCFVVEKDMYMPFFQ